MMRKCFPSIQCFSGPFSAGRSGHHAAQQRQTPGVVPADMPRHIAPRAGLRCLMPRFARILVRCLSAEPVTAFELRAAAAATRAAVSRAEAGGSQNEARLRARELRAPARPAERARCSLSRAPPAL